MARFLNMETALLMLLAILAPVLWAIARAYPPEARQFPQIIAIFVFVLCVYLLAMKRMQSRRRSEPAAASDIPVLRWHMMLALVAGSVLVMQFFGLGTGLLMLTFTLGTRLGLGPRPALFYGLILSSAIRLVFGNLLGLPMPAAWLFPLY